MGSIREPEALYHRIMQQTLNDEDGAAIRWMISGLQWDENCVRLHTMGRLSIEELAYMGRWSYGAKQAPCRKWLNQWGRKPDRPLPRAPGRIELETENERMELRLDEMPPGDEHRIDEDGCTYAKLNGHLYWLRRSATE